MNGWSSELQPSPPRQSVGQVRLTSPTSRPLVPTKHYPLYVHLSTTLPQPTGAVSLPGYGTRQWLKDQGTCGGQNKLGERTKRHHSQLLLSLVPSHTNRKSMTEWAVSVQKLWTTLGV